MICRNCSLEGGVPAYCVDCDLPVLTKKEQTKKRENVDLLYSLKPKFNPLYNLTLCMLKAVPIAIVLTIAMWITMTILAIEIGGVMIDYLYVIESDLLTALLLIYAALVVMRFLFVWIHYINLEYNFYPTKMERTNGFINRSIRQVEYDEIRRVGVTEHMLQRAFNQGSIVFQLKGSSFNDIAFVRLHCIENTDEELDIINKIID